MASESVYENYSKVACTYDKFRSPFGFEIILGSLARYARDKPLSSLNILDGGCGTGSFTLEICKYVGHVTAIDCNDDMLAIAKGKLKGVGNVTLQNVDLKKDLPFNSMQFDGALLILVAHHMDEIGPDGQVKTENMRSLILELNRVLKEGAPLILAVFTDEQFTRSIWYYHFAVEKGFSDMILSHTKRFISLDLLENICKERGFVNEKRIVSVSERIFNPDHYFDPHCVLLEEYRLVDSSWRDFEKCEKFSYLLEAFQEAINNNEIDYFIRQSESICSKEGVVTFLLFDNK